MEQMLNYIATIINGTNAQLYNMDNMCMYSI